MVYYKAHFVEVINIFRKYFKAVGTFHGLFVKSV